MTIKNKLLTISIAAITAVGISACNTVRGVGQDISSGGHAIATVATDVQKPKPHRAKRCTTKRCVELRREARLREEKRHSVKKSRETTKTTTKKTVKSTNPDSTHTETKTTHTETDNSTK